MLQLGRRTAPFCAERPPQLAPALDAASRAAEQSVLEGHLNAIVDGVLDGGQVVDMESLGLRAEVLPPGRLRLRFGLAD